MDNRRMILTLATIIFILIPHLIAIPAEKYLYSEHENKAIRAFYFNPGIKVKQLTREFDYIANFSWNASGDMIAMAARKSKKGRLTIWIYDLVKNKSVDLKIISDTSAWYDKQSIIYTKRKDRRLELYDILKATNTFLNEEEGRWFFSPGRDMVASVDKRYVSFVDGFSRAEGGGEEIVLVNIRDNSRKQIYREREWPKTYLLGFQDNTLVFEAHKELFAYDLLSGETKRFSVSTEANPILNSVLSPDNNHLLKVERDQNQLTGQFSKHSLYMKKLKTNQETKLLDYLSLYFRDSYPKWHPNGKQIALIIENNLALIDCSDLLN